MLNDNISNKRIKDRILKWINNKDKRSGQGNIHWAGDGWADPRMFDLSTISVYPSDVP